MTELLELIPFLIIAFVIFINIMSMSGDQIDKTKLK